MLAFVMLLACVLTACGSAETATTSTTVQSKDDSEFEYNLSQIPSLDYGKQKFGVFGVNGSMSYMMAEEENGDLVNDAVFHRNIALEERYNLEFNMFEAEPNAGVDMIKNFVISGDTTYHLYQSVQHSGMPQLILNGYFNDWTQMDAIRFENPYWNTKGVENLNFGGKIYVMGGDLNLVTYNNTNCVLFNKKLFDDLGIDYPYEDVYNKTWTIDKMISIVKQGYADLNGDTQWDTDFDRLGFSGWASEMLYGVFMGLGGKSLINDENNMPTLALDGDNNIKIIDKMIELLDGEHGWMNGQEYGVDNKMFNEGRLLMKDSFITGLGANRNSEFDIGLVPYPMLDEAQGEYYSRAANIAHLSYIPTTNQKVKETGIILEAMSIESYNTVRPTYYDITLSLKEAADEESIDMVDIVLASSSYLYEDIVSVTQLGSYVKNRTNTFASWYASNKRGFEKTIEKKILPFYTEE